MRHVDTTVSPTFFAELTLNRWRQVPSDLGRQSSEYLCVGLGEEIGQWRKIIHRVEGLPPRDHRAADSFQQLDGQREVMICRRMIKFDQSIGFEAQHAILIGVGRPIGPVQGQLPSATRMTLEGMNRAGEAVGTPPTRESVRISNGREDFCGRGRDGHGSRVGAPINWIHL